MFIRLYFSLGNILGKKDLTELFLLFRTKNSEGQSNEQKNKESDVKCDPSAEGKSKKKRRSFDGNETVKSKGKIIW
jgi:hypothetical protein